MGSGIRLWLQRSRHHPLSLCFPQRRQTTQVTSPWGHRAALRAGASTAARCRLQHRAPMCTSLLHPRPSYPYLVARCRAHPGPWKAAAHLVRPVTKNTPNTHTENIKASTCRTSCSPDLT